MVHDDKVPWQTSQLLELHHTSDARICKCMTMQPMLLQIMLLHGEQCTALVLGVRH